MVLLGVCVGIPGVPGCAGDLLRGSGECPGAPGICGEYAQSLPAAPAERDGLKG